MIDSYCWEYWFIGDVKFSFTFWQFGQVSVLFSSCSFDVSVSDHCIAASKQLAGHSHHTRVGGGGTIPSQLPKISYHPPKSIQLQMLSHESLFPLAWQPHP